MYDDAGTPALQLCVFDVNTNTANVVPVTFDTTPTSKQIIDAYYFNPLTNKVSILFGNGAIT